MSGGPDSIALLLLANAAFPGQVFATTVDHGLRCESAAEAAFVARLCGDMGLSHETVAVAVEAGNVQDRARTARYRALYRSFEERGVFTIATAHHADDQAETLLMRLARGSGIAGLAGVRARRVEFGEQGGEYLLLRPLLHWRRDELAQVVAAAGIEPVRDPSNEDERFDRVRIRRFLAENDWLDPLALARSAQHLQEAEDTVNEAVASVYNRFVSHEGDTTWFQPGHPRLVEVEVVRAILEKYGAPPDRSAIAKMCDQLCHDGHATLAGVAARRAWYRKEPRLTVDSWRFDPAPPRNTG